MKLRQCADSMVLVGALLIAAGCGGSQAAEPATPSATEAEAPAADAAASQAPAPEKEFDDMAPAEQLKFMKEVVAPTMAKKFQEVDAEHYADFGCTTCHGPGAKDGNFEMPTASLPKLPEDMDSLMKEKPEVMKFMIEVVKPEMAKLLGEGEDFGCFDCHTKG
ncbi:MAG TPA: hypothetical protein VI197_20660 [Polyangiaceae bacterium]